MAPVAEAVNDGHVGGVGQLGEGGMGEHASHDGVYPTVQIAADVGDGLAHAHLEMLVGEIDGMAAELRHAGFKGGPGPERRLFEDHR